MQYAKEKRTGTRQRQALVKDVLPIIGRAKAAAVTRRDIGRITDRMTGRGVTIGASRTFEIVRKMFNWAVRKRPDRTKPVPRHEKAVQHATARSRAVP